MFTEEMTKKLSKVLNHVIETAKNLVLKKIVSKPINFHPEHCGLSDKQTEQTFRTKTQTKLRRQQQFRLIFAAKSQKHWKRKPEGNDKESKKAHSSHQATSTGYRTQQT